MKRNHPIVVFVLILLSFSCDKPNPEANESAQPAAPSISLHVIDWVLYKKSYFRDTLYHQGLLPEWSMTRETDMDLDGTVILDQIAIRISGYLYLKRVVSNDQSWSIAYLAICEIGSDHCLDLGYFTVDKHIEVASMISRNIHYLYKGPFQVERASGRFLPMGNTVIELDLSLMAYPLMQKSWLELKGNLYY